jgi:hypothetical protein
MEDQESITRTFKIVDEKLVITRSVGPTDELVLDYLIYIVKRGKLYKPASDHYKEYGIALEVYCDKCKKSITESIGIDNKDLCLDCVENIKKKL